MRFVLLGDVMVDITAIVTHPLAPASDTPAAISVHAGGSAANTAAWLAVAGHEVTMLGSIGADGFGDLVRSRLQACGVTPHLQVYPELTTGVVIAIVDADAERTMLPDPGANSAFDSAAVPDEVLTAAAHFHLSGYTLLNPSTRAAGIALLERARAAGLTTSLDSASSAPLRRDPSAFDSAWSAVDVVLANADEATVLTGQVDPALACASLAGRVPCAVVKLGSAGARGVSGSDTALVPAESVRAIDTTGAGDAFAAGFLPAWLGGATLADALGAGCRVAGEAVSRVGAEP